MKLFYKLFFLLFIVMLCMAGLGAYLSIQTGVHRILTSLLAAWFVLLIFSTLIVYTILNHLIGKRLAMMAEKAKKIKNGFTEPDLEISGKDELSEIAGAINTLCIKLSSSQKKTDRAHQARVKALEQLRHTERLSTIGQISAGIAHEMGTPLNIVSGRAKMIESGTLSLPEMVKNAVIIKTQSERMTEIIRQLLDFTRRRKPRYSTTNIRSLIKQVFEIMRPIAKKRGVVLKLVKSEKTPVLLKADPNQIQQVMINLIMNSIQAMPDGGNLDLKLSEEVRPSMHHAGEKAFLRIKFSDTGDGIAKDDMARIFEPFFTTKKVREGTGLGLPIAQGIIEEHSGWIEVEAGKTKGAGFIIYLPMER